MKIKRNKEEKGKKYEKKNSENEIETLDVLKSQPFQNFILLRLEKEVKN